MTEEINAGYRILKSSIYNGYTTKQGEEVVNRIVIGINSAGAFVTWDCRLNIHANGERYYDYYFGHYFIDENDAYDDYYNRLAERHESMTYHYDIQ